ncbi:MAG TPA: ABC transporter permease [Thermomicrobiales bacterium]|nr:ABC transporter permease [Thermomicrobiales bacterium]
MDSIWTTAFLITVLAAAIPAGTAILYASLGELIAERAGVINLGVEGMMLMGALGGVAVTIWTGSAWLGVIGAMFAGAALATLHAIVTIPLRGNQVVSGLALTLFGTGLSAFLGRNLVGKPLPAKFSKIHIPLLSDTPALGRILFQQDALTYLSFAVVPILWYVIFRTQPGLHLRAIGEKPAAADAMGVPVNALRFLYVVIGGAFAGLGGAVISLATNPGWTEGMTAGRGWIAIALVIFAGWNPIWALAGAYLFGGVQAGQFQLQVVGVGLSPFFLNMLPYLFTIIVLVIASGDLARKRIGAPAALGRPYIREER